MKKNKNNLLKFLWEVSPVYGKNEKSIPQFLTKLSILEELSLYELKILSSYLHLRHFAPNELVFSEGEEGFGMYFIMSGQVDVVLSADQIILAKLTKNDYFGEISLLEQNSIRTATVISKETSLMLGFFRPDLDALISDHPKTAVKIIKILSSIAIARLRQMNDELREP